MATFNSPFDKKPVKKATALSALIPPVSAQITPAAAQTTPPPPTQWTRPMETPTTDNAEWVSLAEKAQSKTKATQQSVATNVTEPTAPTYRAPDLKSIYTNLGKVTAFNPKKKGWLGDAGGALGLGGLALNALTSKGADKVGGQAQLMQQLANADNEFINNPPTSANTPERRQAYSDLLENEMRFFNTELGQYPDQFNKILGNHRTRMNQIKTDYEKKGQYEANIADFTKYAQGELGKQGIDISDPTAVQSNPKYQAAIAAMKSGRSIEEAAAIFRGELPEDYSFGIDPSGYDAQKGTIGDVRQTQLPTINRGEQINVGGTMINRTDLESLLSGDNNLANKASGAALDSLMQTLKSGGGLTPEQMKQLQDPFTRDSLNRQGSAERDVLGSLSARGFGTNAAAVVGGVSQVANEYETQRSQQEAGLMRENLMAGIQSRQVATQGLADLAASERQARISAAEIGSKESIAQAGITSEEKGKQAQLRFAQDELFQNGQLSQAGLQLDQNLKTYGLQLDKYQTDQGFDLDMAKMDLQERLAQSGLDVESAKMQADNMFKSLDVAINDKKIDSDINTAIARLEQEAATGDRDARMKVDALRVEQNLRQQGLDHELAMFTADLQYRIMSGREKIDADMFMFLKQLDNQIKQQNKGSGLGGFLGGLVGTVVGAAAGGIGAGVGAKVGSSIGSAIGVG